MKGIGVQVNIMFICRSMHSIISMKMLRHTSNPCWQPMMQLLVICHLSARSDKGDREDDWKWLRVTHNSSFLSKFYTALVMNSVCMHVPSKGFDSIQSLSMVNFDFTTPDFRELYQAENYLLWYHRKQLVLGWDSALKPGIAIINIKYWKLSQFRSF